MSISSEITALNSEIANHFNSVATFTPATGDPVPLVRVELSKEVDPQAVNFDSQAWAQVQTIEGLLSEIGREPDKSETFIISAVTYTVQKVLENDGYFVKMAVT